MESPSATRCSAGASDADPLEVGDGGAAVAEGTWLWIGGDAWPAWAHPDASTTTASAATSHRMPGRVLSRCNAK